MGKILKYSLVNLLRSRVVLAYTVCLFAITTALFALESDPSKALVSLSQVVLNVVPLVCLLFTAIQYYNSLEFTELLVVQPLRRRTILLGQLLAQWVAVSFAYLVGVVLPLSVFSPGANSVMLSASGVLLGAIGVSLGFLIALANRDKARGIGVAILLWLVFVVVYDGLLLLALLLLADYPIEPWVVPLASLNPIDLARIQVMLRIDLAAMLGYTGAVYKQFFGSLGGLLYTFGLLLVWLVWPAWVALRLFLKKDF
ncbi:MAG: ABC transporter permease subunit [Bacteroidia bacterium]|nr:ABC transporter permease subunit [Bacteroidia bacterium]